MKEKEYVSGQFCIDVKCPNHEALEGFDGDDYLAKKAIHCKECFAWIFFNWMKEHNWKIVKTIPEMSAREIAARIKGIDPDRVEDITVEEIMCI